MTDNSEITFPEINANILSYTKTWDGVQWVVVTKDGELSEDLFLDAIQKSWDIVTEES